MTRDEFAALHTGSEPLVLFNIWDAGSARIVAEAGARAIATGSLALAGALGLEDGEAITFADLLRTVRQIHTVIDLPLTVDIESGYADDLVALEANAHALLETGVIGCNVEDRLIGAGGLRDAHEQAARIDVLASAGLFVNARTDLFLDPLMRGENPDSEEFVEAALVRAGVFCEAGAGCLFVPGLGKPELLAHLCKQSPLPVNVMRLPGMGSNADLASLGVARISHGPAPWHAAMQTVGEAARAALG